MVHIHVMGASGSGTTSLGRALADRLDIAHLDTDDFFWLPTDPPFTTPREFLAWAASYDTAGPERRSLAAHEQWLETQTAPVLRLDSSRDIDDLLAEVLLHPAIAADAVRRR